MRKCSTPGISSVSTYLAKGCALAIVVAVILTAPTSSGASETPETAFEEAMALYESANQSRDPNHPDFAAAIELWRPLVEAGHQGARYHLGLMHYFGAGGATFDQPLGIGLIRKAADGGYPTAQAFLGLLADRGDGTAVRKSQDDALAWYQKAAAGNSCAAIRWLANAYREGYASLQASEELAAQWSSKIDGCRKR